MPNWPTVDAPAVESLRAELDRVRTDLIAERETRSIFEESLADLELAREDAGWGRAGTTVEDEFSVQGRKRAADQARLTVIANPLAARALALRTAYIWSSGPTISVEDSEPDQGEAQDINGVVQAFLDDARNRETFTGALAHQEMERALMTDGELFFCLPTNTLSGQVLVRIIEPDEITEIVTNPDDRTEPWFYKREYVEKQLNITLGSVQSVTKIAWYPALGYNPRVGFERLKEIGGKPVLWNQPIRHLAVNRPTRRAMRGLGDLYPALPWIKATKEVLEAWVLLFKAVARYSYQVKTRGDRRQQAAAAIRAREAVPGPVGNPNNVGGTYVGGVDQSIEAVSKTGAVIDANGAKPIISMVSAAVGLPITMLMGDPGVSGARAVAETLDEPTQKPIELRRDVWTEVHQDICGYVIDWAVKTRKLRGTVSYDGTREVVTLAGEQDRTVNLEWPGFDTTPVKEQVEAIMQAADELPPELTLRLLLAALKVKDADEVFDAATDDEGHLILDVIRDAALDRAARQDTGNQQQAADQGQSDNGD